MKHLAATKLQTTKRLALLCVLAVAYGATAWDNNEKPVLHAAQGDKLSSESLQPESLLIRSLGSADGYSLAEGHWQFPGMPWAISQSPPTKESELLAGEQNELPTLSVEQPVALDQHFLSLIKSLMTVRTTDGQQTWYRLETGDLRGSAITVHSPEAEIPAVLRFRWRAHNDLWTEVAAIRQDQDSKQTLLQLPAGTQMIATRVSAAGLPQCHLISSKTSLEGTPQLFSADGWTVEFPPADTRLDGLFWISNETDRFEISVRAAAGISGVTAFIRSI